MTVRVALFITILMGCMYAAAGLLISLRDFGIGMAIAATAVLVYGCLDFVAEYGRSRRAEMRDDRDDVWARRDAEAFGAKW